MVSKHYENERNEREKFIAEYICDNGNIVDEFVVDRGHPMGREIHSVTDTGLIIVRNENTGKLVTKLIARPKQIMRYYKGSDREPPKYILDLAQWHMDLGYNEI